MPRELKAFLLDYPRKAWSENPNFTYFSEFWLQRHEMFRELSAHLVFLSQSILNKEINLKGTQTPINKEIYEPVLKELENYGIFFNEK